ARSLVCSLSEPSRTCPHPSGRIPGKMGIQQMATFSDRNPPGPRIAAVERVDLAGSGTGAMIPAARPLGTWPPGRLRTLSRLPGTPRSVLAAEQSPLGRAPASLLPVAALL